MQLKKEPLLSVVMLSYNHKKYIEKCLESVFEQQVDFVYEILLADDCSPDETAQMVQKKYGDRVTILERKRNLGLCKNMYDAFMQARGKYIFVCSGDDYLPVNNSLARQVGYLEEHEEIFSVTGWHEVYNVNKGTKKIEEVSYEEYSFLDFLRGIRMSVYQGTMRNTFKEDNPIYWCQGSRNNEEMQLIYYVLNKGVKKILPELYYTYCYRNDAGNYNSTHTYLEMLKDYVKGFQAIEGVDRKKYNFSLAKTAYYETCIDYYIQDNGIRAIFDILKVMKFRDSVTFIGIKLLMRLNKRRIPSFLLSEKRLIKY